MPYIAIALILILAGGIAFLLNEDSARYYQEQLKECERKKGIQKFHRNGDYLGCDVPTRKD